MGPGNTSCDVGESRWSTLLNIPNSNLLRSADAFWGSSEATEIGSCNADSLSTNTASNVAFIPSALLQMEELLPPKSPVETTKKSKVTYRDIAREDGKEPLRWIHIAHPNKPTLYSVASHFNVKIADLESCLKPVFAPNSYRYGDYLVNRFTELSVKKDDPLVVESSTVLGLLGDSFIITISDGNSEAFQRVWSEVDEHRVSTSEVSSSNHLFSRLLGSSLHHNEEISHQLEIESENFLHRAGTQGPTHESRVQYRKLKEMVLDSTRGLQNNLEVIHSLREERNLFGAPAPRKALDRYQVIHETILSRLHHADEFLNLAQDDWRVTLNEHQNSILFRMALLSGALTPVALVSSLFGMNFPGALPYTTSTLIAGLVGSVIVSVGLVTALILKRPFPRER